MQIRHATIDDIDLLIKLRVDYLLEENKLQELKDIEVIKENSGNTLKNGYLLKAL